ncbi:MAG: hypothetical protein K2O42_10470, partial [Oscillospiraceae bacterium]|nr:hypothetical protein [Oscillospiraceae bacterium]
MFVKTEQKIKVYGKFQSGLFTVLSVISLLVVCSVLLICMTLRYEINAPATTTALAKIILQEIRIPQTDGSEKSILESISDELGDKIDKENL